NRSGRWSGSGASSLLARGAAVRPEWVLENRSRGFRRSMPIVAALEFPRLPLRILACKAVTLLQLAGENLRVAFHLVDLVVGEFAPLFLDLAFELFELTAGDVSVHVCLRYQSSRDGNGSRSCKVQLRWRKAGRWPRPGPFEGFCGHWH